MYAPTIQSNQSAGAAYYRRDKKRSQPRHTPQETGSGAERIGNTFLRQPISHIAPKKVVRSQFVEGYNYLTRANYLYLQRCVANYARLLGKEFTHNPGSDHRAGIANLYEELQKLVGDQVQVNINTSDKRLVFVLWTPYAWGEYNVYWLPMSFVEKLPARLQRLTLSFLHQFRKSMRIDTVNSSGEFEFILEWQYETLDDYEDEKDRKAYAKYLASYGKGGKIHSLLERIENKNYHKDLRKALDRYAPASDYEKKLVGLMKEGLSFIGDDVPTIFQYEYDPCRDEDMDENPVTMDMQFLFMYENDAVIEALSYHVDDYYNNYGAIRPCATLALTPDGNELFGEEPFPKAFFDYMDRFKIS